MSIKLFISQPMRDKTDEEILAEREKAIKAVSTIFGYDDVKVINSFFQDVPHDAKPLWYLGESIKMLGYADVAYFCEGWDDYRGCQMEHKASEDYGIQIIEALPKVYNSSYTLSNDNELMLNKARELVAKWYNENTEFKITKDYVLIVWFCKTLQNWKAICSTTIHDKRICEVTHNGDKYETYLDVYLKESNNRYEG